MEWQKGCFLSRDLWNEAIVLSFLQQVIAWFLCTLHVPCDPCVSHPLYFPLSLLGWSFLFSSTFVHEAQARGACYPFDIFWARLMLARLWNRSSCNMGPPQHISCPASVLCASGGASLLQCHGCSSSQPEASAICLLWPWLTGGGRSWFTVSWEVLWLQASLSISLLSPQLSKALEWSLLSCCLQLTVPLPAWQKVSLWHWWLFPEKVSTVSSRLGCFDISYSWWRLKILVKNHYSGGRIFFPPFQFL